MCAHFSAGWGIAFGDKVLEGEFTLGNHDSVFRYCTPTFCKHIYLPIFSQLSHFLFSSGSGLVRFPPDGLLVSLLLAVQILNV